MDQLLNPSFMKDPPVKLDIPAKTLGLVYAILGAIGTFFGVFGLLGLSAVAAIVGAGPLYYVGTLIGVIGTALSAWGGYQMYQENRDGKRLAIYGIVLNAVGSLIASLSYGNLGGWIVTAIVAFILYYLVVISRFAGEPKLVTTTAPVPPTRREGPPAP